MAKPRRKAREEDSTMVEVPRLFGDSAIDPVGDPSDSPAGDPAGDPVGDPGHIESGGVGTPQTPGRVRALVTLTP